MKPLTDALAEAKNSHQQLQAFAAEWQSYYADEFDSVVLPMLDLWLETLVCSDTWNNLDFNSRREHFALIAQLKLMLPIVFTLSATSKTKTA